MAINKTDILVFAHWKGMQEPKFMGVLSALRSKGKTSYSFEYDTKWLESGERFLLDPDIRWFSGRQYPAKDNFGVFLDSMPDTWGRTLMKRRAALRSETYSALSDIDYLLGVYDEARMGGLRFKLTEDGNFLDDSTDFPTPPWSSVRELQHGVKVIETDNDEQQVKKWLQILMAPGSSLGGARPKANILDESGHPWIAKFPSKNDTIDKALWEYLAYRLAVDAGINMSESKVEKVSGRFHTFFTKRFDREEGERIHFASAMTMTGNTESIIRDEPASYLDIAEFIQFNSANVEEDLKQLWRRMVFNISISNTDDHLRNHGFILTGKGWRLSPAFDINPSTEKDGLALNIDTDSNELSFDLAFSVGEYFMLDRAQMKSILEEVLHSVSKWQQTAKYIGIPRSEQMLMKAAFRLER
jgi:serine/threonine-protein kinase HipA